MRDEVWPRPVESELQRKDNAYAADETAQKGKSYTGSTVEKRTRSEEGGERGQ
jgi:hypothetical protein